MAKKIPLPIAVLFAPEGEAEYKSADTGRTGGESGVRVSPPPPLDRPAPERSIPTRFRLPGNHFPHFHCSASHSSRRDFTFSGGVRRSGRPLRRNRSRDRPRRRCSCERDLRLSVLQENEMNKRRRVSVRKEALSHSMPSPRHQGHFPSSLFTGCLVGAPS
jgi:hypothetical protein